ncbi:MAG: putative toxin-antitoxin system toxin component, PIN family [Deltaproteobacteria bacterium]|nr:putative toxin-antitoxin system toxin component, PIN family [Deltaproteobacteria bacterium]
MIRVVLDTNVLVSAAIRRLGPPGQAFDLVVYDERFRLVLSDLILAEARRVLGTARLARYFAGVPDPTAFVEEYIGRLDRLRIPVVVTSVVEVVADDPPDNHILACALDGRARYLVTGNRRHFGALGEWRGIQIVDPAQFLAEVGR